MIEERYNPLISEYGLNEVTIPKRPSLFCDERRTEAIVDELMQSQSPLLVLLGDIPIKQFLKRVASVPYGTLQEYVDMYGYGNRSEVEIRGRRVAVLPLAHPRQIGALGAHSERWRRANADWERMGKT